MQLDEEGDITSVKTEQEDDIEEGEIKPIDVNAQKKAILLEWLQKEKTESAQNWLPLRDIGEDQVRSSTSSPL